MANPYELLPSTAFWRSAVAERNAADIGDLWIAKFSLTKQSKVLTAGSCFAQHIGRELARSGYAWHDSEPAPPKLSEAIKRKFNYGVFSFRTGNIYTVALLRQWVQWATGQTPPAREVWVHGGRVYDPFRPNVEPNGFATTSEMRATRDVTLKAIRRALGEADLFIFTLGLTEAWINRRDGTVYPICPGTIAGEFDPEQHRFHNYSYNEIAGDLNVTFDLIRRFNPNMRFLLTVSPVPLTATASSQHVLVATTHSKSTLRAVAGDVANARDDTDYFPSYEMISGFPFRAMFYEPNMRAVSSHGVAFVMRSFFAGLAGNDTSLPDPEPAESPAAVSQAQAEQLNLITGDDLICEDVLLDAFGKAAR